MANDDLAEIAGKVDKIVRDLQAEKERNRRDFPQTYNLLTIFKAANPRAIYAEENGRKIGRVPE